jgi:hypothetical protein
MDTFPSTLHPHQVTEIKQIFSTHITKFENEREQRFMQASVPKRKWRFQWFNLSSANLETLRDFHEDQGGAFKAWSITDTRLGAGAKTLRFSSDEFNAKPLKFIVFNLSLEVETC